MTDEGGRLFAALGFRRAPLPGRAGGGSHTGVYSVELGQLDLGRINDRL